MNSRDGLRVPEITSEIRLRGSSVAGVDDKSDKSTSELVITVKTVGLALEAVMILARLHGPIRRFREICNRRESVSPLCIRALLLPVDDELLEHD